MTVVALKPFDHEPRPLAPRDHSPASPREFANLVEWEAKKQSPKDATKQLVDDRGLLERDALHALVQRIRPSELPQGGIPEAIATEVSVVVELPELPELPELLDPPVELYGAFAATFADFRFTQQVEPESTDLLPVPIADQSSDGIPVVVDVDNRPPIVGGPSASTTQILPDAVPVLPAVAKLTPLASTSVPVTDTGRPISPSRPDAMPVFPVLLAKRVRVTQLSPDQVLVFPASLVPRTEPRTSRLPDPVQAIPLVAKPVLARNETELPVAVAPELVAKLASIPPSPSPDAEPELPAAVAPALAAMRAPAIPAPLPGTKTGTSSTENIPQAFPALVAKLAPAAPTPFPVAAISLTPLEEAVHALLSNTDDRDDESHDLPVFSAMGPEVRLLSIEHADPATPIAPLREPKLPVESSNPSHVHLVIDDGAERVVVTVAVRGNEVNVALRGQDEATTAALARNAGSLDHAMRARGLDLASLMTGRDPDTQQQRPDREQRERDRNDRQPFSLEELV